ncbi:endonuclease/exonuclease/phosphatase family protein [Nocardioides stalactiti]|uniref:endonuclease/exonuclease/phosphatase family protein n=1 Tax=Nocardioides stalactiti TaxID=2755356 RepID=UPI0015FFA085|nr:endonuclease/exonuclease/phosphatase family protein [Nocardioides stalactiti]
MTGVATANLGNRPDAAVLAGLHSLALRADVFGLQECGDRLKILGRFCTATGWECWTGDEEGSASTPVLWNPKAVEVSRQGTRPATEATNTGRLGAGPDVVKAKVWNHARVHAPGEDPFVLINGHLPASLYLPRRRALAKKQIADLADMVERREDRIDVVVVGDMNARPNALVLKPLRRFGMKQRTHQPTHGRRTIDHVWTLGVSGRVEVVSFPSDHRVPIMTTR